MQTDFQGLLEKYNYNFPEKLIAQKPAHPRDSAKLLICHKKNSEVKYSTFKNILKFLPKNAVLVFNETKVIPARIYVKKTTGGKVELLYLHKDQDYIFVLANRPITGNLICQNNSRSTKFSFQVVEKINNTYKLKPNFPITKIEEFLLKFGHTPLPPYIKNSLLSEKQKRKEYQAIFAKTGQAVAAPTAGLHFTKNLIKQLKKQGIAVKFVRLDVGLGTFAPLKEEQVKNQKLHKEYFYIDPKTAQFLNTAKKDGRPIIAVGTTVVRTLESSSLSLSAIGEGRGEVAHKKNNSTYNLVKLSGESDLFISEGYKFKFITGLITNFHVPKSSLMMLVSALMGREKLLGIYQKAIYKKFRLFSFGDGMLILD
jgi:S-adenosylmethionine:tRNA ribosyltransferase-isomerase